MYQLRKYIILFLFIMIISALSAIDSKGIKASLNYTTISGSNIENTKFQPGFSAGVFGSFRLNNWLTLQPELLFSSKGSDYNGKEKFTIDDDCDGYYDEDPFDLLDNDGDGLIDEDSVEMPFLVNGSYRLYYIEIPMLLKFSPFTNKLNNLDFVIGPSFNILLDGNYKLKWENYKYTEGDLNELKPIDICSIFGITCNSGKYQLELRASQSLIENEFKSVSKLILESYDDPGGEGFGPSNDEDYQYTKYAKHKGYNSSISLMLSVMF